MSNEFTSTTESTTKIRFKKTRDYLKKLVSDPLFVPFVITTVALGTATWRLIGDGEVIADTLDNHNELLDHVLGHTCSLADTVEEVIDVKP